LQEIFEKPNPQQVDTTAKKQKPLTASQRRRIQKCKRYNELKKKREEQARQRADMTKQLRPCKYYQSGNCNKVSTGYYLPLFLTTAYCVSIEGKNIYQ